MKTIAFRVTDELEAFIRQQAAMRKTSISEYIRSVFEALKTKRARRATKDAAVFRIP